MNTNNEDDFKKVVADVKEIKDALLGNDYNKGVGMVATVTDHDTRLDIIEKKFQNGKWLLLGLSLGSGVGIGTFLSALVDIFGK